MNNFPSTFCCALKLMMKFLSGHIISERVLEKNPERTPLKVVFFLILLLLALRQKKSTYRKFHNNKKKLHPATTINNGEQ